MPEIKILNHEAYGEIVDTLAEAARMMVGVELGWSEHEDEYLDQIDRMINSSRLLANEGAQVLALSPNSRTFWEEYSPEEIDELIEEMGAGGNLVALMAYYALQTDVKASVKTMIKTIDIMTLIP